MIKKIYKTENVIKIGPEDTLSSVIPHFTSSHDAGFVFEDPSPPAGSSGRAGEARFMGVVNPYYALIKKSYPANTKAKHCLVHPPKIDINFSLSRTAQLMMSSKIHYLPVFENDKFIGIISARRIIEEVKDSDNLAVKIESVIDIRHPLITIFEDDYISKAMAMFKKQHISKLIVTTNDHKIRGVLSYYDLISYLTVPKERAGFSRTGNNTPLLQTKVRNFMKTNVLTLHKENTLADAAELILKREIGSVLVVDAMQKPIGIITTRDILTAYCGKKQLVNIDVVTRDLSDKSKILVNQFIEQVNHRFIQKHIFDRIKVIVKEGKGKHMFETVLSMFKRGHSPKVIKKEGRDLEKVLQEVGQKSKKAAS